MPEHSLSTPDRRLLQAIADLFARHGGQPPTLGEIAVELGYRSSSRANIQRRLAGLSPRYVVTGAGARSIRLTPAAYAVLETPAADPWDDPLPDDVLRLLASGLTWLTSEQAEGRPPRVPYRDTWQRALNRLVCGGLERGTPELPTDAIAVARLCQRPLHTWPVRFALAVRFPDETLLIEDEPTAFCRELAQGLERGDTERELQEKLILPVLDVCRMHRAPHAYVAFRDYLIRHPVVEMADLIASSLGTDLGEAGQYLLAMYESVPAHLQGDDGTVPLCPVCGWTLARTARGTLACGDDRCRLLSDGFARVGAMRYSPGLQRVRRAIRRFVVAPGRYEVDTADQLRQLGSRAGDLQVDLWPSYDAYDLRITFPDGHVWAVDVKDWRYPTLLARALEEPRRDGTLAWHMAFFAVPRQRLDGRLDGRPDYLDVLAAATPGRTFDFCTLDDLVVRARERLAQARRSVTEGFSHRRKDEGEHRAD